MTPKKEKLHFLRFNAIFVEIPINVVDYNLKRFTKTRTRCPVVVYEDKCGFLERKRPKNDKKKQKFQIFNVFIQVLSSF